MTTRVSILTVSDLRKPGTFAGNDVLVAFANLYQLSIVIHRLSSPAFRINPSGECAADRELHLTYQNGEHYSSVRMIGDRSSSPAYIKMGTKVRRRV